MVGTLDAWCMTICHQVAFDLPSATRSSRHEPLAGWYTVVSIKAGEPGSVPALAYPLAVDTIVCFQMKASTTPAHPLNKFRARVLEVVRSVAPPQAAVLAWNLLPVSCPPYWVQLQLHPLFCIQKLELRLLNKLLHLPGSCPTTAFISRLHELDA